MKKMLLAVLLLSISLFAECYKSPAVCGEKYQNAWYWEECYVQNRDPNAPGYFQTAWYWEACYVQDKDQNMQGYVQDSWYWEKNYIKDKAVFGLKN
jgi:hypothetical protein